MASPSKHFFNKTGAARALLLMVLIGLAVRLLLAIFSTRDLLDTSENYFSFGWEVGRVARSIASGHGFGSPFNGDTGATAVLPPLYPYFVAAVFAWFGTYTKASALVILAVQSVISAFTCIPVYFIALRTFGSRIARLAGWTWTFFPYAVFISAATIWSTSLSALLLALLFWLTLCLAKTSSWRAWLGFGLLAGVTGLTNPAMLILAPVFVGWVWLRLGQRRAVWLPRAAVATAIALLCVAPWVVRNYRVFGRWVPLRSNFGLELYVGNSLDTSEYWHAEMHPAHNTGEMQEMERLGEMAYMARKQQQAFTFIRQYPSVYLWLTLKRIVYFWTGIWNLSPEFLRANLGEALNIPICTIISALAFLGLRRAFRVDRSIAWLYLLVFVFYPLVYYVTTVEIPYRHPLDPLIVILMIVGVTRIPAGSSPQLH
jgi:4-amino-4-deoxy-L-arabinose transferase-like glycosyltransferase